jgi:hypothetical protein
MLDFLMIYSKNNSPLPFNKVDPFINNQIKECLFDYRQGCCFFSARKDRFAIFCSTSIEAHLTLINEKGINFFDGIIIQDEACIDIRTLKPILDNGAADHSDVFGNYCYGFFSENGTNHVHGGVLGQYPLFIGFSTEFTVISNNPHLAAYAIHGKEYQYHKNIMAQGWILSALSIKELSTSYDDVYFFPQNAGVVIDENNFVSFYSLCNDLYYPMGMDEWNENFHTTYSKLLNFLFLYYTEGLKHGIGAEITGGFDSRATLALAIQAGIHKNIEWTVQGYGEHPDVVIAKSIASEFGLNLRWYQPKEFSLDKIESSFEASLMNIHKTAGMTQYSEVWSLQNDSKPFMLTGVAGEMFRGYRSLHLAEKGCGNTIIGENEREFLFDEELALPKNCFNPGAFEYYHNKLMGVFKSFDELYSFDLVYCRTRQPQFHGGLYLRSLFPHICCIGYNSWLHRLSMIEAPELRASNDIGFRLIENSTPGLLYFPLDRAKWSYLAYSHSKHAKKIRTLKSYKNKITGKTAIYFPEQLKFLFHGSNVRIHDSVYQIFNEKYIKQLLSDSVKMINNDKAVDVNMLAKAIDVMGVSAFLNNQELSPVSGKQPPTQHTHLDQFNNNFLCGCISGSHIYSPPLIYKEPAKQVIDNMEMCFQRNKVFRSEDHNMLAIEEQRRFASQVKKNTITLKGRIKELVPPSILNLYRMLKK